MGCVGSQEYGPQQPVGARIHCSPDLPLGVRIRCSAVGLAGSTTRPGVCSPNPPLPIACSGMGLGRSPLPAACLGWGSPDLLLPVVYLWWGSVDLLATHKLHLQPHKLCHRPRDVGIMTSTAGSTMKERARWRWCGGDGRFA
jgi:hypothetical protein